MKKKYRSFEEAKKFVQTLKLNSGSDWKKFYQSGKKPDDIPNYPNAVYKNKGWNGWGDFLGTGYVANQNREYRSFEEAKKFVQKLKISSKTKWSDYCKSGKLPDDISSNPDATYKKQGKWTNWGDFLGTGRIANQEKEYCSFEEAKKFVQKLNLKSINQWKKLCKSGNLPDNISFNPNNTYKKQGTWTDWGDFLGTGYVANQNREYRSFEEAKKFVQKLGIKTQTEWRRFDKTKLPKDIPNYPNAVYKNKGWKGMGDFLGTGYVANQNREYRSFEEAKKFVQKLGIKTQTDWRRFDKTKLPKDIPKEPTKTYKKKWKGWGDWLGTGTIAYQNREYLSITDAKIKARNIAKKFNIKNQLEWSKAYREGKIPKNLPADLWYQYGRNK